MSRLDLKFVMLAIIGCALPACSTDRSKTHSNEQAMTSARALSNGDQVAASPRVVLNENDGWHFKFAPGGAPQSPDADDAAWQNVTLPHTWNAIDGASTDYAAGDGWYRKSITLSPEMAGKQVYLHFEGGSLTTSLFIDGTQVDLKPNTLAINAHRGGFQAFDFDVTEALAAPVPAGHAGHLVAVKVNNNGTADLGSPPSNGGDYSKEGGLYRNVSLVGVDPVHIALTHTVAHTGLAGADTPSLVSGSGVQFSHTRVSVGVPSTTVTVKTWLDNTGADAKNVSVISTLVDADGVVRAKVTTSQALTPGQTGVSVMQRATFDKPHLWDGRIDPYLYDLYIEVRDAENLKLLDMQHEQVGIRSFKINAQPDPKDANPDNRAAFMLNGHPYRVVGVDMHQDSAMPDATGRPVGWARSAEQIHHDIDLLVQMGGTGIRTSHYQDNREFYNYCDKVGVLVYTEDSLNGRTFGNDSFLMNAQDQYYELILQNFNSPSIFAWGFGNEISGDSEGMHNVFTQLNKIGHELDPARFTAFAQYGGSISNATNADGVADIKGTHPYDYWYGPSDVKKTLRDYPSQPLGVTEYGGGASAYQYADQYILPASKNVGGVRTHFHPANAQTRIEELHYSDLSQLDFLWGLFTWQFFDHASSSKNEGDQGGINDKGLVTRDRIPKDSYYFYKAALQDPKRAWNNDRVLYISDRFWTVRNSPRTTITVFSNVGTPTLTLNGKSIGAMTPFTAPAGPNALVPGTMQIIPNTYLMDVTLATGENTVSVEAKARDGAATRTNAKYSYRNSLEGTPFARIDFVPSGQTPAATYLADDGRPFGDHNGKSYGWLPAGEGVLAVGKPFGGASDNPAGNGIALTYNSTFRTSSTWEMKVPNGTYDVRIGAGEAGNNDNINNIMLENETAGIDTNGSAAPDTFFARVVVKDGKLTLSAAPGAWNARVSYIDINKVGG